MSDHDHVTTVKVVAHTRDGRVFESLQTINDLYPAEAGVCSAIEDAEDELVEILRDRGLLIDGDQETA